MKFNYMSSTNMDWHENSYIKVEQANAHLTRITVNREGLLSLSEHFIALANSGIESCCYEEWPGDLEEGSVTLEIVRVDCAGRRNS